MLSNTVKQKRAEKAGKWSVPIPKVKPVADDEMFKALASGKRKGKIAGWLRLVLRYMYARVMEQHPCSPSLSFRPLAHTPIRHT